MKKSTSPLLVGVLVGSLSCIAKNTVTSLMIKKGLRGYDAVDKAAGLMIKPYKRRTPNTRRVGWLADMIMGVTVSTILATLHKKRTLRANPASGLLAGLFCWTALWGGLGKLSSLQKASPRDVLFSAGWHSVFGVMSGSLIQLLLEQDEPAKTEEKVEIGTPLRI